MSNRDGADRGRAGRDGKGQGEARRAAVGQAAVGQAAVGQAAVGEYPMESVGQLPAADIAAAWQRELAGARTESIEIITPIWRIAKVLADDRRRTLARLGIDPATLDLLSAIRRSGPPYELTTREITRRTLVTAGAISQRIARAEQAGLVRRSPSAASRRAVGVRLTESGHALVESTVRRLLEHEARHVDALPEADRAALAGLLARLERALIDRPADRPADSPAD